jgi:hypothetical protein
MILEFRRQNNHAMMGQREKKKYWVQTEDPSLKHGKVYGKCKRHYIPRTVGKVYEAEGAST